MKMPMKNYSIIIAAMSAVIGLMVFSSPEQFVKMIVIILGVASLANGAFNLSCMSGFIENPFYKRDLKLRGWSSVAVGLLAIFLPMAFAATLWTVMLYVLAFYLLASAVFETYAIIKLKGEGIPVKHYASEIAVSFVLAVFLIAIPGKIGLLLVKILGLSLIAFGIILGFVSIKNRDLVIEPDSVKDDDSVSAEDAETSETITDAAEKPDESKTDSHKDSQPEN